MNNFELLLQVRTIFSSYYRYEQRAAEGEVTESQRQTIKTISNISLLGTRDVARVMADGEPGTCLGDMMDDMTSPGTLECLRGCQASAT